MANIDNNIKKQLLSVYNSMEKETIPERGDGWVNLAKYGPAIKKAGIDYHQLGFAKLGAFVASSDLFDIWDDRTKKVPVRYIREKRKTKRTIPVISKSKRIEDSDEIEKVKTRLRLKNNFFIGQFSPERTPGWFKITDIRDTGFTKIEDKERGVKDLSIVFRCPNAKFNRFAYYKFSWVLLESSTLKFGIDLEGSATPMYPQDIVECLHDAIVNYDASSAKKITRTLDTLNKQLTQSGKEVFIYELLQNANDYPRKHKEGDKMVSDPVDVEFHITDDYLTFQHTGDYFNAKNIAAICDINDGEKSDNVEAIGYKGIGFKTVFLDNDYVYLRTGDYSFRFDKSATDIINTPWQILPVWTETNKVNPAISSVFSRHSDEEYRVKFALKPRDKRILNDRERSDNYIDLFSSVFESERVILFIPNIRKVSVFWGDSTEPVIEREKSTSHWCVSEALTDVIPEDISNRINEVLTNPDADKSGGYDKIPEKYLNFSKTAVKFACKREGRTLLPVEDAILYCYLPAKKADWGFKFLMNTDMIPNGARDDIADDVELNHEISKIAGRQFFYWIKGLIASKEYDLDSIFALIPDFKDCKEKKKLYQTFIQEFQDEFEILIKKVPFVPVVDGDGNESLACIDKIIDDLTGITEKNVMSDSDFISLMEMSDYCLPIQELRESECFMDFIYRYCPGEMDVDFEEVKSKCSSDEFETWLKDLDNNTRFIGHLIDKNELENFATESIFVEYEGDLFSHESLYYDFDTNCSTISFLKRFVPHLCEHTRNQFSGNEGWESFMGNHFKTFVAKDIIKNHIINNSDAIELLRDDNNSVNFFRFIADNEVDVSDIKEKIPYITEAGDVITDYENRLYFYSEEAYNLSSEIWLGDNVVNVLSHIYLENDEDDSLKTLFEGLGCSTFDKGQFITDVIAGDSDFRDAVNKSIEDDFDNSVAFIKYLFSNYDSLKEKNTTFKEYVVSCIDIDGDESYLCDDDVRYFNQASVNGNSTFEDNKTHPWIKYTMMFSLNPKYFDEFDESELKAVESFFRNQFGIKTFTDKSFFSDVVLKNKKEIYDSLTDEENMLAFISYLKRDAARIFDGSLSYNDIKEMPLLCSDGSVISERDDDVKLIEYDDDAVTLLGKEWCPEVFAVMSEEYSNGFSRDMLQLFKIGAYDFNEILTDILDSDSLQEDLEDPDNNIDFWRWILANAKKISDFDALQELNLLDTEDECQECSSLYISDTYQKENGIEGLVKKYEPDALFVSANYLEEGPDKSRKEWLKLFKNLGLKSDNKDMLFNSVLPNLSTFEEDSVVAMMTKHLKDLEEVWEERKDEIIQLRVRTKSGDYKTLNETIVVDIPEEKVKEPFKYIQLSDEVAVDILENNRELLQRISGECSDHLIIKNKQAWAEEKIAEYIDNIQTDDEKREAIHVKFVQELAKLCNDDYEFPSDILDDILYRVKGDEDSYKLGSELTLGHAYSPACDFEINGVTDLDYLSEDYIFEGNRDIIKSFFKQRGLHCNVDKDDLEFLSKRKFAVYFWSHCFTRRISVYKDWIKEGLFNDIVCVPTTHGVKKAEDLYHPDIVSYAMKSNGWREKVPFKGVVVKIQREDDRKLFNTLPFNKVLSFEDCLNYLLNARDNRGEEEVKRRKQVIDWILQAEDIDSGLIDNYRKNSEAKWRNGKGQNKHISELYAIHPNSRQERNIFKGDEHVIQTNMFPSIASEFERICGILLIKCLTSNDFSHTPINSVDETREMMQVLKPRLLVLAAIEKDSRYKETYEKYDEIISKYKFYVCDKIDLCYETIRNDVERIYCDDDKVFYVNSWLHKRTFTKFCSCIKRLLGISVLDDVCEDVLDGSEAVEESIAKYCQSFVYDKDFREYLDNLDCSVSVEEEEEEPEVEPEDYYGETVPTEDGYEETEDDYGEDSFGEESQVDEDEEAESTVDDRQNETSTHSSSNGTTDRQVHEPRQPKIPEPRKPQQPVERSGSNNSRPEKEPTTSTTSPSSRTAGSGTPSKPSQRPTSNQNNERHVTGNDTVDSDALDKYGYDSDQGDFMGSVNHDRDYEPLGSTPRVQRHRNWNPRQTPPEELDRLRSRGIPLELESLPPTRDEIDALAECGISAEQIADTNYLAQLRLYQNLVDRGDEPEESREEFVKNAKDVTTHKLKGGKYIHACSAARGVMYISPSVWNKVVAGNCAVCVYLDGRGKNFKFIDSPEKFLDLVEKDDVVIKITGKEKVDVVRALYSGLLRGTRGTAYTLIRVASRTNMDAVFAHYVGAMAEADDGNDYDKF